MKERIQAIINKEGITPSRFADIIGVQRSGISHILSGRNKPSLDFLNKVLIQYPHISGDWLITGQGEMLKHSGEKRPFKQLSIPTRPSIDVKPDKPLIQPPKPSLPDPVKEIIEPKVETAALSVEKELFAADGKKIERILVFYQDKTFREYRPE